MQTTVARVLEDKGNEVWTTARDATVFEALGVMADKHIGALVVVEFGRPVGLMSERDYARKVVELDRDAHSLTVGEIMTDDIHVVGLADTTADCMAVMTDERTRHLPVVDDDRLIGLVSIGDVVKAVMGEQKFLIEQLEAYIWS